jgi:exosome complex component RRP40
MRQYIPAQKELVLGTVIARHSEGFRVDLGSSQMASLDALAFEGATKRSKPNLKVCPFTLLFSINETDSPQVGMLVYARVSLANRDMETEIECFDAASGKAEGFGELKGGTMITTSLEFARQ